MMRWRGQDAAVDALLGALGTGRLHHGWLLGGPAGVGKGGIARDFAKRLLGAQGPADRLEIHGGDGVARLVEAGTHPDLVIVERLARDAKKGEAPALARNIGVDQIRALSRFLHLAPSLAERRVVIIDSADDMERGASNALLKNLEEPPPNTLFLLVSHAPGRLLSTIRSRCRYLPFQMLADSHVDAILTEQAVELNAEERAALIRACDGSPGRALLMRGLDLPGIDAALTRIADTGDPNHRERIALARALAPKAAQKRYETFIDHVPHFIAHRLRTERGGDAALWEEAVAAGRGAATLSLDPAATVFGLCGIVARLAPPVRSAA